MTVVLWTTCQHAGAHVVDLSWGGGATILVSAFAGWLWGVLNCKAQHHR